jgi:cytoskeletal protein CcmA (bactofilin family)
MLVGAARAEPGDRAERALGPDRFAAGGMLQLGGQTTGDLIAAGGDLDIDGRVGGDLVVAGGKVAVRAPVAQDLYAAGGRLWLNAAVGRNARLAGGTVELGPQAQVAGSVTVAGGEVLVRGTVDGYLQAGAAELRIDGTVRGDVITGAGEVELGPNARILGKLRYASRAELKRDPAAQVAAIERIEVPRRWSEDAAEDVAKGIAWVWTAGLVVLAALFAALLPGMSAGIAATVRARWAGSLLVGFVALVCIPVGAAIAAATVIGIPLALASVAAYLALLLLGYVAAGVSAGTLALGPVRTSRTAWRIAGAALGMLAISLLARIPYAGWLVVLAALLLGLGALLTQLKRAVRP